MGRVRTITDYKGQVKIFDYNITGLVEFARYYQNWATLSSNYPANGDPNIQYAYDALGRKAQVYFDGAQVQDFGYDIEGRILSLTTPQGSIGYKYDAITGRKTSVYEPADNFANASNKIGYTYDGLGRLKEAIVNKLNGDTSTLTTTYGYNAVGAIASILHANGNYVEYTYDALNRLTKVENWKQSAKTDLLSRFEYFLNPDGMRASVTETLGAYSPVTTNYGYDNLNRLTSESGLGYTYVYDLAGDRRVLDFGVPYYYFYNDKDQLLKESWNSDGSNPDIEYLYDDNGSLTQRAFTGGDTYVYTYNLLNQLDWVTAVRITTN